MNHSYTSTLTREKDTTMTLIRRLSSGAKALLAAAIVAGAAIAVPAAAHAAPANINPDTDRSLTLTKMSAPTESGYTGTEGEALTEIPTGSIPLSGVALQIQQVTEYGGQEVNLLRAEGWDRISALLNGDAEFDPAAAGTMLAPGSSKETGVDGTVAWMSSELPIGLYWVTETDPGEPHIAQPVKPFLISVPAPVNDEPGVWNYHPHAYPKNTVVTAEKTVDESNAEAIGDGLRWTISGTIPANPSTGVTLDRYQVVDTLPEGLEWAEEAADAAITFHSLHDEESEELTTEDFTLDFEEDSRVLTMTLGEAALARVQGAIGERGGHVAFSFTTRVLDLGAGGVFDNEANVLINQAEMPTEATSYFGPLDIRKIADGDENRPLADGHFQIFASREAAETANEAVKNGQTPEGAIDVLVAGEQVTTFVTDDTGSMLVPGLKTIADGLEYWVVETRAPAGYIRTDAVYEVTVKPEQEPTGAAILTVSNPQQPPLTLVVTGAAEHPALKAAGALLLLAGVGAGIASIARKRISTAQ